MVLRREEDGGASLLSLPRDLWVPIAGTDDSAKINSAYNEGPQRLARTVTESLGIPIHHYVEVDFHGFTQLVDAIGGVEICVENAAQDENTGLRLNPGARRSTASWRSPSPAAATTRSSSTATGRRTTRADLGRIARQQLFIRTAVDEAPATSCGATRSSLGDLIGAATGAVRIDEDVDPVDAANALRGAAEDGLRDVHAAVEGVERDGQSALELDEGSRADPRLLPRRRPPRRRDHDHGRPRADGVRAVHCRSV